MNVVKAGYPPHQLTLIPELPVSSLGFANGDQVILTQKASSAAYTQPAPAAPQPARDATRMTSPRRVPAPVTPSGGVDHVETGSGVLVHRVRLPSSYEFSDLISP